MVEPKTKFAQRALRRVSPIYENSRYMKLFYDALGTKWDKLMAYFMTLREQHFIDTVDWG